VAKKIRRGPGKRMVDDKSFRLADEVRYIQRRAAVDAATRRKRRLMVRPAGDLCGLIWCARLAGLFCSRSAHCRLKSSSFATNSMRYAADHRSGWRDAVRMAPRPVTYVDVGRQQWPQAAICLVANWSLPRARPDSNMLHRARACAVRQSARRARLVFGRECDCSGKLTKLRGS